MAVAQTKLQEYPVIWLQAATCTGCSVSILNSESPTIKNVLIDPVVPGKHINLRYHATVMAGAGEPALEVIDEAQHHKKGGYILVVEGAIPTAGNGRYGSLGEKNGALIPLAKRVEDMGRNALAVVALGTCAAFGGIAAASPNPAQCRSVAQVFQASGVATPLVNIPGCPPHPDWFVGTVASVLLLGLAAVASDLDELGRPKAFFSQLIHENCPRRAYYDEKKFAKKLSDPGCLYELGCKGPLTHADCATRLWNGGVNWCVGSGGMCIGCAGPGFPDLVSPIYQKSNLDSVPNIAQR